MKKVKHFTSLNHNIFLPSSIVEALYRPPWLFSNMTHQKQSEKCPLQRKYFVVSEENFSNVF